MVMTKRAKASRTYRDSLDYDAEILGSTQGSSAPGILQSNTSSRPARRAASSSSSRSHIYNYRWEIYSYDGDEEFFVSTLADNNGKDLSDVEVV